MPEQAVGPWARRIFAAVIVVQAGIVVTGSLVRLTSSGLGCPTWPKCAEDSFVPTDAQDEGFHKFIEFGNRLLTFVVLAVVIASIIAAWRQHPRRRPLLLLALAGLGGVVGQAILGGVTVLLDLHPATVAAHFLLSIALIAAAVVLHHRGRESGDGPVAVVVRQELRLLAWTLTALGAIVIVLGTIVTGSGPHSGDADEPARFGFDLRAVSWLHADAVILFVGLVIAMLLGLRLTGAPQRVQRAAMLLLGVTLAQGLIGYTQYLTGLPELLVAMHVLGACLLWIAVLHLQLTTRTRSARSLEPTASDQAMTVSAAMDRKSTAR
jgi:cytochrome c oxidase assembly protein subunit 15